MNGVAEKRKTTQHSDLQFISVQNIVNIFTVIDTKDKFKLLHYDIDSSFASIRNDLCRVRSGC